MDVRGMLTRVVCPLCPEVLAASAITAEQVPYPGTELLQEWRVSMELTPESKAHLRTHGMVPEQLIDTSGRPLVTPRRGWPAELGIDTTRPYRPEWRAFRHSSHRDDPVGYMRPDECEDCAAIAADVAGPLGPDCRDGKCRACSGQALDEHADTVVRCAHHCHRQEPAVRA